MNFSANPADTKSELMAAREEGAGGGGSEGGKRNKLSVTK